jgi:hypothetical protein
MERRYTVALVQRKWKRGLSDDELGFGASAAGVGRVRVTRELDLIGVLELQGGLEALANLGERLLAGFRRLALADRARPETDTVEAPPNVHDHTHDLVVVLVLEVLANRREHDVQPQCIDVDSLLVLELEGPLAAVLVLRVLPLRPHALLEQVVVGLERQIGSRGDVVLVNVSGEPKKKVKSGVLT